MKCVNFVFNRLFLIAVGSTSIAFIPQAVANCVSVPANSFNYVCSGVMSSTEVLMSDQSLNVYIDSSYQNNTIDERGLILETVVGSSGNLTVVQEENSVIHASDIGVMASSSGPGVASVTTAGSISGEKGIGLQVDITGDATGLYIEQKSGSITGYKNGIYAVNWASGKSTMISSGNITATSDGALAALYIENANSNGTDLIVEQKAGIISAGPSSTAVLAYNHGTGSTIVDISGTVIGGVGINTATGIAGKETIITIHDGGVVSGTSGTAIKDDSGNATVTLKDGAKVIGSIVLGGGSDTLNIDQGADVSGLTVLDGGSADGTSSRTDTDTDTLNINQSLTGSSGSIGESGNIAIINWEAINIGTKSNAAFSLSGELTANDVTVDTYGTLNLASGVTDANINSNVTNRGIIDLSASSTAGSTLTINGDYTGDKGQLILNSVLSDDNSATDKLVINGNASGTTYVSVNNLGGSGAQTVEGIKVIDVTGTSSTDAFVQQGRIVAGSYEYYLGHGTASGTDSNSWYLTSKYIDNSEATIRPEAGSYLANLVAANSLFNLRLHDRLGETQYTDLLNGEQKVTSMWLRYQYGNQKFNAGHQLNNKAHWNIVQLGGDIAQWTTNNRNRLHFGIMWGYGRSSSDSDSQLSGYRSTGTIDGYSAGVYGTWYDNDADKSGLYIDSWLLWKDFDASVNGQELNQESYNLRGLTASLESGYNIKLGQTAAYSYWLQPKGQLTWMNVDADEHREANGTHVTGKGNNWQTRFGLRATMSSSDTVNQRTHQAGQLFIEANWLYNTKPFAISMDGQQIQQDGAHNIGEIKAGLEGNIAKQTNVWFNLAYQYSDHHYSNSAVMLGLKYSF